jgi:hypothetical protein
LQGRFSRAAEKIRPKILIRTLRLFSWIRRPHPFIFTSYSVILPGVLTVLLIIILAPLHFQSYALAQRSLLATLLGLIVAGCIWLTVQLLRRFFPKFTDQDNWTIGKEVLLYILVLLLIDLVIWATLGVWTTAATSAWKRLAQTTCYTLGIGLFPVLTLILFEQYQHQRNQLRQADHLTKKLREQGAQTRSVQPETPLQLQAENGKLELQLFAAELLCLRSDGNYVETFYLQDETVKVKLIRNKLKYFESVLPAACFCRCHKRFIVNGTHIVRVVGNARNLELGLRQLDFSVPVSRAKVADFQAFLAKLPTASATD